MIEIVAEASTRNQSNNLDTGCGPTIVLASRYLGPAMSPLHPVAARILMIIKGLFRRYERWNPVHPTYGAFWGMGIGVGCGVGWGPGFGPDVIGYVGAGCGIGFSVGITLAGVGIGLPTNFLIRIPYNALEAARSGAFQFARSSALPVVKNVAGDGWNNVAPYVSSFNKEACGMLPSFKVDHFLGQGIDLTQLRKSMTFHVKSVLGSLGVKDRRLPPAEDT